MQDSQLGLTTVTQVVVPTIYAYLLIRATKHTTLAPQELSHTYLAQSMKVGHVVCFRVAHRMKMCHVLVVILGEDP